MKSFFSTLARVISAVALLGAMTTAGYSQPTSAATNPAKAKITFTFDDARQSSYSYAAPILAKYGLKGTIYVTTGCVGMTTVPNTCHAANDVKYLSWPQVTALQNTYKWEVGSHSVTHPYLASFDAGDGQPKPLTQQQVVYEVTQSKADLAAHGINAKSFASPYGDYNDFSLKTISKYYSSHRAFAEQNDNVYPYNDRLINNMQVQGAVTLASVAAKIDAAINRNLWLVLTFHDILPNASKDNNNYQWSTRDLESVASYVKARIALNKIQNVNTSEAIVSGTNILAAPIANGKFGNGWTTDSPTGFSVSGNSNGSYPEPATAVMATSTTTHTHLFSPRVIVSSSTVYVLKQFLNVTAAATGEVGFYIDEFDANGNWVSGQYKTRENSKYLENINFVYQPTSLQVKTASLQIYNTANSGITAYLDSFEWIPVATDATTQTNLMPNGTFDTGLGTWRTDNTTGIVADTASHGSSANSINSIAFNVNGVTSHLFSPSITVTPTKQYLFESYINVTALGGGQVGYYLDEYDAAGNWVSGQYKATVSALGASTQTFSYTPTSANVAKVSYQVIYVGGTGLSGYFDDVKMFAL